ncbi:MAG: ATP phosphoribosyltransferase [Acidilobaceae archaeon]
MACRIKLAIPKGSLEKSVFEFFDRAGLQLLGRERSYKPVLAGNPDICIKILRPQEIPLYVYEGSYDLGITGIDWVVEHGLQNEAEKLLELGIGRVKLVVAIPKEWKIENAEELIEEFASSNRVLRVSSEYLVVSSTFLASRESYKKYYGSLRPLIVTPWGKWGDNNMVRVILSFGATEAKPPDEADAIIDVSETGTTLESNGLKIIDVVMESQAVLIANKESLKNKEKRERILDLLAIMKGAVDAKGKYHVFLNVKKDNLEKLLKALPALKSPTISPLADPEWVAINTVIGKEDLIKLMPLLRALAQGLVVYEPKLVIPLEELGESSRGAT